MVSMSLCQHVGIIYSSEIKFLEELKKYDSPYKYFINSNDRISSRNEYQILNDIKTSEILKRKMTQGKLMPQLAVGVSGLYLDMLDNKNSNLLAFATLSIPISDWWGGSKKMKQHKLKLNIAQNKLDETFELLELEIEKKFKDLNEAFQQIAVAQKSVSQAEEHHKVINDNFQAGVVSTSDLLEAQALLLQTKDAETNSLCNYKVRLAYYLKSIASTL